MYLQKTKKTFELKNTPGRNGLQYFVNFPTRMMMNSETAFQIMYDSVILKNVKLTQKV